MSYIVGFLLLLGAFFMCLGAFGVLRFPDLFLRLQATTKASTLGAGALAVAVALHFSQVEVTARLSLMGIFLALTTPVGAHLIARAAHRSGSATWGLYLRDDLRDERNSRK